MTAPQSKPEPICLCGLLGWPPHVAAVDWQMVWKRLGRAGDHSPDAGTMVADAPRPRGPRNDGSVC